jgi:hypothetical protein
VNGGIEGGSFDFCKRSNTSAYIVNASADIANASADIANVTADIANVTAYIVNASAYIVNVTADIANASAYQREGIGMRTKVLTTNSAKLVWRTTRLRLTENIGISRAERSHSFRFWVVLMSPATTHVITEDMNRNRRCKLCSSFHCMDIIVRR